MGCQVQNDQCQSTDSQNRWMKVSENDWEFHYVSLFTGKFVLVSFVHALGAVNVLEIFFFEADTDCVLCFLIRHN